MKNICSNTSDITLVITSCGRFDLLKRTLESFIQYNSYPVREIIITEDSGDSEVYNHIPDEIKDQTHVIINNPKLGQIKSIDLAYSKVKTDYIFHCEDDWEFYRPEFIEDSIKVMQSDSKILQAWLRSFPHDIAVHSPYHFLGKREVIENVAYYKVGSHKPDWQGFSFNPGLKRLCDYKQIGTYACFPSEKQLSRYYAELGYYAVILENDAVLHTGFGSHLVDVRELEKKRKKKNKDIIRQILILISSLTLGYILGSML